MLSTRKYLFQQTSRLSNSWILKQQATPFYSLSPPLSSKLQVYERPKASNPLLSNRQLQQSLLNHTSLSTLCVQYSTQPRAKLDPNENKNVSEEKMEEPKPPTTYKEKLKQAMAQYGSTVIVFHITISLMSLGACYMLVASGFDLSAVLEKFGLSEKSVNKLASSSGTFAAAYLIHKVFAPVRLSITLTCTPFIVRYLRKAGFIKKALPKVEFKK